MARMGQVPHSDWKNKLFYGDNLDVLREHIADESVDLIYLDPPFNSKRDYNLLFKTPKKPAKAAAKKAIANKDDTDDDVGYSDAQITAFEDTWHWNETAEREFGEIMKCHNSDVAELMQALRSFLKENDMLAYLTMMCNRLLELHRVLKPTGSLYLHCDPTASHYLKLVLDGVFGNENFRNEIIWRRTGSHNSAKRYGPIHDTLLFYAKTPRYTWNRVFRPYLKGHVDSYFKKSDERGRYWSNALTGAGTRNGESGKPWRGFDPTAHGRHWAIPGVVSEELGIDDLSVQERLDAMFEAGYINLPRGEGLPEYRQYLHQSKGTLLQDVWAYQPHTNGMLVNTDDCIDEDVRWIGKRGDAERLGYPTQKPLALLERIISASSNEGNVVLDPFCGCGTAVHAAEKLKRRWIGIDITHLSIGLIEKRMKEAFPYLDQRVHGSTSSPRTVNTFVVIGTPQDFEAARDLAERDKYQFQSWACMLVGAQLYKGGKKGADGGIDGLLWIEVGKGKTEKVIVQVKGGLNVTRANIATLVGDVGREKAAMGLFISLVEPTREMVKEAAAAGMYESPHHGAFPKIQILTIEGLLSGKDRPNFPDLSRGEQTFKKAKREKSDDATKQGTLI
jgi:DNA modification methylase